MQYNKVEISGVNTSQLPVMKESEKTELLKKLRQGDKAARDRLIRGNLRLVLSVLQGFAGRGDSPDDMFQVGVIGLIKAIDNFDVSQQVRFSTYAVPMIAGEVRRYLRDYRSLRVSRSMRDTAYKVMQAKEALTAKTGREPTAEELSAETGIKRQELVMAMESAADPLSLYEPVYSEGGDTLCLLDQLGDRFDDTEWLDDLAVKEAIASLKQREKNILFLRYFKGKTQTEVAKSIGISQAQVSRLEKSSLDSIKKRFRS
ncbi:MAG: RNA polymerase sporulation sigma factor SigG [Ruminococcus sp.]|nr:RNA polymerase sporulation sigma factor SigG [Ruminococcus sp.]